MEIEIPTLKQVTEKLRITKKLNPLEGFIFNNEPLSSDDSYQFRVDLLDLIEFIKNY